MTTLQQRAGELTQEPEHLQVWISRPQASPCCPLDSPRSLCALQWHCYGGEAGSSHREIVDAPDNRLDELGGCCRCTAAMVAAAARRRAWPASALQGRAACGRRTLKWWTCSTRPLRSTKPGAWRLPSEMPWSGIPRTTFHQALSLRRNPYGQLCAGGCRFGMRDQQQYQPMGIGHAPQQQQQQFPFGSNSEAFWDPITDPQAFKFPSGFTSGGGPQQ